MNSRKEYRFPDGCSLASGEVDWVSHRWPRRAQVRLDVITEVNQNQRRHYDQYKWQSEVLRRTHHPGHPSPRGEPVFKGTRIALRTLLASLAGGDSLETILTDLPAWNLKTSGRPLLLLQRRRKRIFRSGPFRSADSMKNKLSSPAASVASRKYSATISGRI